MFFFFVVVGTVNLKTKTKSILWDLSIGLLYDERLKFILVMNCGRRNVAKLMK